jgi:hypothetical protein
MVLDVLECVLTDLNVQLHICVMELTRLHLVWNSPHGACSWLFAWLLACSHMAAMSLMPALMLQAPHNPLS